MKSALRLQSSDHAVASLRVLPIVAALLGGLPFLGQAAGLTTQQTDFFENKIRPVLVSSCYKCHSTQAEKIKGGLLLDSREGVLRAGTPVQPLCPAMRRKVC